MTLVHTMLLLRLRAARRFSTRAPIPATYMRALPAGCVHWSDAEGQRLFAESLAAGTLECHFSLVTHFHTQVDPAFCGQATLSMALNALTSGVEADAATSTVAPAAVSAQQARRYDERSLDCCRPVAEVMTRGISVDVFSCLARCAGAAASVVRPPPLPASGSGTPADDARAEAELPLFRAAVERAARARSGRVLVAAYSREALGQTGALGRWAEGVHSGHYSPLGGYHAETDSVLIMDVARFKYPPHWVSLRSLWRAMRPPDPETQLPRGYVEIALSPALSALQVVVGTGGGRALLGAGAATAANSSGGGACCASSAASRHCRGQGAVVDMLGAAFDGAGAPLGGMTPAPAAVGAWSRKLEGVLTRSVELPHMCAPQLSPARLASIETLRAQIERLRLFDAVLEALRANATGGAQDDGGAVFAQPHTLTLLLALRHAWQPAGQPAVGAVYELAGEAVAALGVDPLFDGRPTKLGTGKEGVKISQSS